MVNFSTILYCFVDDEFFWQSKNILTRFQLDHPESEDTIYIHVENLKTPEIAIPFSTYDGFSVKNILWQALGIHVYRISSKNEYPEIVEKRLKVLQYSGEFHSISNKKEFLINFCKEHQCSLSNILYFGNDLGVINIPDNEITIVTSLNDHSQSENIFTTENPHGIRKWVDKYTRELPKVQEYYRQTSELNKEISLDRKLSKVNTANDYTLFFDIDGTLTDGYMIFASDGTLWKKFSKKDIDIIKKWNEANKNVFFITGESGEIPEKLAEMTSTPLDHVFMKSSSKKLQKVYEISQKIGLSFDKIIYMGDDMNDIGVMKFLMKEGAYVACPASAIQAVLETVHASKFNSTYGFVADVVNRFA